MAEKAIPVGAASDDMTLSRDALSWPPGSSVDVDHSAEPLRASWSLYSVSGFYEQVTIVLTFRPEEIALPKGPDLTVNSATLEYSSPGWVQEDSGVFLNADWGLPPGRSDENHRTSEEGAALTGFLLADQQPNGDKWQIPLDNGDGVRACGFTLILWLYSADEPTGDNLLEMSSFESGEVPELLLDYSLQDLEDPEETGPEGFGPGHPAYRKEVQTWPEYGGRLEARVRAPHVEYRGNLRRRGKARSL